MRSTYRRHILRSLSRGDRTISQITKDTGLDLAHVSRHASRMRDDGWIEDIVDGKQRGRQHRITSLGSLELKEHEKAVVARFAKMDRPLDSVLCVCERLGDRALLICLQKSESKLHPCGVLDGLSVSSGNEGVRTVETWLVEEEGSSSWLDPETLEPVSSPPVGGLLGFDRLHPIRIVRARVFACHGRFSPSLGWQTSIPSLRGEGRVLADLHDGDWECGWLDPRLSPIRPQKTIFATARDPIARAALLRAAAPGALTLTQSPSPHLTHTLPASILNHWISMMHPRTKHAAELAEILIFDTEKEIYGTLPPSLDRLVRRSRTLLHHSFPGWRFTHDAAPPEWLDLGRLSSRARECVIDWSLHQIDRPVSIETEFPDIGQIRSARASVRLILSQREPKHLELVRLDVHAHSGRILSELCLPGIPEPVPLKFGVVMERIDDRASRRNLAASRWLALLNRHPAGYLILADPSLLEDPMIQSAIDRPIGGDEAWANSVEALHPLAAWLATPSDEHRSRWQRIHSSIDDRWIGLIDPSSLPFDELVSWSMRAPESWRSRAAKVIERQISRHPDRLAELVVEIARQDSDASSWLSTIIIQGHRNLPSELAHQSLEISISRWCARPCKPVVSTLESLVDQELVDVDWGHLKQSGRIRTDLIQLSNWISLVEQIEHGRSPSQEWASLHLLELPESWWSAKAPDWLNHWVEERTNGPWLLSIIESWPNLLLRPAGSLSGPPSTPPLQYPGIDSTFLPVLEDIRGACLSSGQNLNLGHLASLDDVIDALRDAAAERPPISGRTHPWVSLLTREKSTWPIPDSSWTRGDQKVTSLLFEQFIPHN